MTLTTNLLTSFLLVQEAKADKVKAALIAKYPNDIAAVNQVLAANMLGPATWFPAMQLWSANKAEPVGETIAAITAWMKNKETLGDLSQFKSTDDLRGAISNLTSKSAIRKQMATAKAGTDRVYEDKEFLVVFAKSKEASCAYGAGTTWCTAATETGNMFYPYARNGVWLYYIINKLSDPREDPYAKMSIGFDDAGSISWGRNGGLSVNAKNDGLTPIVVQEYLGAEYQPVMAAIQQHYKTNRGHEYEKDSSEAHPALANYWRLLNDPVALKEEMHKVIATKDHDLMLDYIKGLGQVKTYNPDAINVLIDALKTFGAVKDESEGFHYSPEKQAGLFAKFFKNHPEAMKDERIWNHVIGQLKSRGYEQLFPMDMVQTYCNTLSPETLLILAQINDLFTVSLYGIELTPFVRNEYADQNPDIFESRFEEFASRFIKHRSAAEAIGLAHTIAANQQMKHSDKLLFCNEILAALALSEEEDGPVNYSAPGAEVIADICMGFILDKNESLPQSIDEHPQYILGAASPEKVAELLRSEPLRFWLYEQGGFKLRLVFWNLAVKKDVPANIQNFVAEYVMMPAMAKLSNVSTYRRDLVRLMLGNFNSLTHENRQRLVDYYQPTKPDSSLYEMFWEAVAR